MTLGLIIYFVVGLFLGMVSYKLSLTDKKNHRNKGSRLKVNGSPRLKAGDFKLS